MTASTDKLTRQLTRVMTAIADEAQQGMSVVQEQVAKLSTSMLEPQLQPVRARSRSPHDLRPKR